MALSLTSCLPLSASRERFARTMSCRHQRGISATWPVRGMDTFSNGVRRRPASRSACNTGSGPIPGPRPSTTAWRVTKKWSKTRRGCPGRGATLARSSQSVRFLSEFFFRPRLPPSFVPAVSAPPYRVFSGRAGVRPSVL
jgi:hypothetical protein